jgi:hypothetical protein
MVSNYEILLDKIDKFIKRFYLNLLIKGSLFFGAGFLILLLTVSILEYFQYFNTAMRFILFYGFILFNAFVFIRYVLIPFFGLLRIGRKINPKEAGRILGKYFKEELNDQITNTLELHELINSHPGNADLLLAGIEQKAKRANIFPFNNAIKLRGNLRYLPFFIVPLLVIAGLILVSPAFLFDPVSRIIKYDNYFEKPLPFTFVMENERYGFRNKNLDIIVKAEGEIIPASAEIILHSNNFRMEKTGNNLFSYTVRNLQEGFRFYVLSEGYRFGPFVVDVIQKPSISHFSVHINYPEYTRLTDENFLNLGDLYVTEGSVIKWDIFTQGNGEIDFVSKGESITVSRKDPGVYGVVLNAFESFEYEIYVFNSEVGKGDSLSYYVTVRPDNYPQIQVEGIQDSILQAHMFHRGIIQDDFGFSKLEFLYGTRRENEEITDEGEKYNRVNIEIDPYLNNQTFYYHFDIRNMEIGPGETMEYFFRVWDNDGVNGPKASRTRLFSYYLPTRDEVLAKTRESEELIKEELSGGMGEVREARDEIEALRRQMIDSDRLSWEQQESVRQLLDKQREIEDNLDKLSDFKRNSEVQSDQFKETNERIKEKQDELQRIFDEILSDELKELFEKIREQLEQLDRNQVYEMLDRMDFEFQDLESQMDRALELFKQLEMERMLQESLEMLRDLKEEQAALSEETVTDADSDELAEKQESLNKDFEALEEMLKDFREKNEELMRPLTMDDTSDLEEAIKDDMKQAADELKKNQPSQSRSSQDNATRKMQQLEEKLESMQSDMFMEQLAEDSRVLREILENLLKTSFAQEDLLLEIRYVNANDPRYVDFIQDQQKIRNDLKMIEDSLVALSKRQIQIQSYVTREIREINLNLEQAVYNLIERHRAQASSRQQFVMTHINNLALLLNESLQNMQMQMQMAGSGGEGRPQPGQGEPSFQNMRQMQEQLNEMLRQMQEGHQPMPGESGQQPMSMSESMARMAAEQEAIRRELSRMGEKLRDEGIGDGQELSDLQREMENTELDIVRKQISRQTILRQEQILTRLLEHEKAELQREMEERRVGNTAIDYDISNPEGYFEYNRLRNRELEMLRSLPPGLKPFYRNMVENYFLNVED